MAGPPPPNSMPRPTPRSSTSELEELRRREQALFGRVGWIDPRSDQVRVPESVVPTVEGRSKSAATTEPTKSPATRPATPTSRPA